MKTVKLELVKPGEILSTQIDASFFSFGPASEGATFLCASCDKPVIEGFTPGPMSFVGVDLVCQHCGAHNVLDTSVV